MDMDGIQTFTRNDFTIFEKLEAGGEATTYFGTSRIFGDLCIKVYHANTSKYTVSHNDRREINVLLNQNTHQNLVRFFGLYNDESKQLDGYVMEYIAGGNLHKIIKSNEIYTTRTIFNWILQVSRGLAYLHDGNIIHRDIKPTNMLITNDRKTIKLSDFGIVKFTNEHSSLSTTKGTTAYMAPEVITGQNYDHMVDIYSLGISIWEIFHRKEPYPPQADFGLQKKIVEENLRPTIEQNLNEESVTLIERCWHQNPRDRISVEGIIDHITDVCLPLCEDSDDEPSSLDHNQFEEDFITMQLKELEFEEQKPKRERRKKERQKPLLDKEHSVTTSMMEQRVSAVLEQNNKCSSGPFCFNVLHRTRHFLFYFFYSLPAHAFSQAIQELYAFLQEWGQNMVDHLQSPLMYHLFAVQKKTTFILGPNGRVEINDVNILATILRTCHRLDVVALDRWLILSYNPQILNEDNETYYNACCTVLKEMLTKTSLLPSIPLIQGKLLVIGNDSSLISTFVKIGNRCNTGPQYNIEYQQIQFPLCANKKQMAIPAATYHQIVILVSNVQELGTFPESWNDIALSLIFFVGCDNENIELESNKLKNCFEGSIKPQMIFPINVSPKKTCINIENLCLTLLAAHMRAVTDIIC